eukprot:13270530-Heterocapsa_arctica.AAC.1
MAEYSELPAKTKAAIVASIMGLGTIYATKVYQEHEDIPDIINEFEKGLRSFNNEDDQPKKHRQQIITEEEWNEYDEIWGFDVPAIGIPDEARQAFLDRERGIPSQIVEEDYLDFLIRVQRRSMSRLAKGLPP